MGVMRMLFSEVYGSYFRVVAAILAEAGDGSLTPAKITRLVQKEAFAESTLAIPAALRSGSWPLLEGGLRPVLRHRPTMPLTLLQKRWMKALLADPRISLFAPSAAGLEDVEPLFGPDLFVWFDRHTDGDPYQDPRYIQCFRTACQAIREKRRLQVCFVSQGGARHTFNCLPYRLEYSSKDDKFRLLSWGNARFGTVNMAGVCSCRLLEPAESSDSPSAEPPLARMTLLLRDERNGLERVLLHFSHFEKETRKLEDHLYQLRLWYDKQDESELLIRVLSFGPVLKLLEPEELVEQVKARIRSQLALTPFPE